MVKYMDETMGKLVQAFKDNGLYDNSIIVFSSDVSHVMIIGEWTLR